MGRFVFIYLTPTQDYFLYTHSNPRKQAHFFWVVVLDTFFRKKYMAEAINLQNTRVKQQFTWTNKLLDHLITRLANFKTLIALKAKYFEGDRNTK